MNITTPLGRLRIVAILEGISYLLFAITMPLKYGMDMPGPNKVVGLAHGILFVLYILFALQNIFLQGWKFKHAFIVLGSSIVPFGTFYVDAKILKNHNLSPERG